MQLVHCRSVSLWLIHCWLRPPPGHHLVCNPKPQIGSSLLATVPRTLHNAVFAFAIPLGALLDLAFSSIAVHWRLLPLQKTLDLHGWGTSPRCTLPPP